MTILDMPSVVIDTSVLVGVLYSRYNLARVHKARANDDLPQRAVVYVNVGELAPVQSRLVNPRVLRRPADALALAG